MAAAVLTPRVRLMTVCDGVRESKTEAGVYHVKGLRQRIVAQDLSVCTSASLAFFGFFECHAPASFPVTSL